MKKFIAPIIMIALLVLFAGQAMAIDIDALDKVSVLMTKSEVKALIGEPHHNNDMILGLTAEVYEVEGLDPMIGAGCIYEDDKLTGQAFIFEGSSAAEALERMKMHGFTHFKTRDGVSRLLGEDDDTGAPIVVVILEEGGWTKIITFEKEFYEKALNTKKSQ